MQIVFRTLMLIAPFVLKLEIISCESQIETNGHIKPSSHFIRKMFKIKELQTFETYSKNR